MRLLFTVDPVATAPGSDIERDLFLMNGQIRIEIIGRDEFWRNAVLVEWDHQFPNRALVAQSSLYYLIESEWLKDLERVADGCFSRIVVAPEDLGRRLWLRQFIPSDRT